MFEPQLQTTTTQQHAPELGKVHTTSTGNRYCS